MAICFATGKKRPDPPPHRACPQTDAARRRRNRDRGRALARCRRAVPARGPALRRGPSSPRALLIHELAAKLGEQAVVEIGHGANATAPAVAGLEDNGLQSQRLQAKGGRQARRAAADNSDANGRPAPRRTQRMRRRKRPWPRCSGCRAAYRAALCLRRPPKRQPPQKPVLLLEKAASAPSVLPPKRCRRAIAAQIGLAKLAADKNRHALARTKWKLYSSRRTSLYRLMQDRASIYCRRCESAALPDDHGGSAVAVSKFHGQGRSRAQATQPLRHDGIA